MAKPCSWTHGGTGLCSLHPSSIPTAPPAGGWVLRRISFGAGIWWERQDPRRGLQEGKPRARGVELRLPPGTAEGGGTHEKLGWPRVQLLQGWEPARAAARPERCCETSEMRSASPCYLPCPFPLLGEEQQLRGASQEDLRLRVGAAGPAHAVGCSCQEDVCLWA